MSGGRREMGRLVKDLARAGFIVERGGSGHWKVRPPEGPGLVVMGFSPRGTAFHKTMIQLRNIGYNPQG